MGSLIFGLPIDTHEVTHGLPKYLLYACVPSTPDIDEISKPKRPPPIKTLIGSQIHWCPDEAIMRDSEK